MSIFFVAKLIPIGTMSGSHLTQTVASPRHNEGKSIHTNKFKPWKKVVEIGFDDPAKATAFEKYLKSGSGRAFAKKHF